MRPTSSLWKSIYLGPFKTPDFLVSIGPNIYHQKSQHRTFISFNKIRQMYQNYWKPPAPKPPYLHICQIGDPVLRGKAAPVVPGEIKSAEVKKLIHRMKKSMTDYDACGLAAPQLGVSMRIIVLQFSKEMLNHFDEKTILSREIEPFPLKVFINPEIKVTDVSKVKFPEACESIKGYSASVPRFHSVKLLGLDEDAKPVEWAAKGWAARIIQHEMDHLDGRLYTDIMDKDSFSFSYWHNVNIRSGRFNLSFSPYKIFS